MITNEFMWFNIFYSLIRYLITFLSISSQRQYNKKIEKTKYFFKNNFISFINLKKLKAMITVQTSINAPIEVVWKCWTTPEDITKWYSASETWHTPRAANDLRKGGSFSFRMEAKDGSMGFDFAGTYDEIILHREINCTLADGRKVKIVFLPEEGTVKVEESFDPESTNSIEIQRNGWQAILDNFKQYVENNRYPINNLFF